VRRRYLLVAVLGLLTCCAPKTERTPQIAVEPFPSQRICFLCYDVRRWNVAPCSPDVERECARLRSDVKGPPTITWVEDAAE
jgi:hypothetical protein